MVGSRNDNKVTWLRDNAYKIFVIMSDGEHMVYESYKDILALGFGQLNVQHVQQLEFNHILISQMKFFRLWADVSWLAELNYSETAGGILEQLSTDKFVDCTCY